MKAMVYPSDGDTDVLDIVTAAYLFIICLDYILRTLRDLIKENGFMLKKQEVDDIL